MSKNIKLNSKKELDPRERRVRLFNHVGDYSDWFDGFPTW